MIVVCEPQCWGIEHVSFNAGILETVLKAFPQTKVVFFGECTHIALLQRQMDSAAASKIIWTTIALPDRKAKYLARLFCEVKIIKTISRCLGGTSKSLLLFVTIEPSTLLALRLCRQCLPVGTTVQVVLHGGLGVVAHRRRHPIRRVKDIATAIAVVGRYGVQYLVLEKNIRMLLLKRFPCLLGRVELLEHPLTPNEGDSAMTECVWPIRFGFLGRANEQKGFPRFVELASGIVEKYGNRAEFHALGVCPQDKPVIPGIGALATRPVSEHLSREMFVANVRKLHFTVFPYRIEHYALSASGALLDAIAWGKPVIAARIPIFENLFQKYGNIGYLFTSDPELRQIVENLVKNPDASLYRRQVVNLWKVRADRTPAALARNYRAICTRAGYKAAEHRRRAEAFARGMAR